MKKADKHRSHSPAGYQLKPNPEYKAAVSLLSPEGYLEVSK